MNGPLPILWSTRLGSEVMQRIAVPMIGGMVSSTVLTLVVNPAVYALVKGFGLSSAVAQIQGGNERLQPFLEQVAANDPGTGTALVNDFEDLRDLMIVARTGNGRAMGDLLRVLSRACAVR